MTQLSGCQLHLLEVTMAVTEMGTRAMLPEAA